MYIIPKINLSDYTYNLPVENIAQFPLAQRDQSQLLIYQNKTIHHQIFSCLPKLLNKQQRLIFNNTKVIPARLYFQKETGAIIEILLIKPISSHGNYQLALENTSSVIWECLIGNSKKWQEGDILKLYTTKIPSVNKEEFILKAAWKDIAKRWVEFSWMPSHLNFSEVLHSYGQMPIPPYLNRHAQPSDINDYQTIYAQHAGAVAAPTAGLHFTPEVFNALLQKNIDYHNITLHVGMGTFLPVKNKTDVQQHNMHAENFSVHLNLLEKLVAVPKQNIAIGTTTLRTLESLYWIGHKLINKQPHPFYLEKLYPYNFDSSKLTLKDSITTIIEHLNRHQQDELHASTEILILPGYRFKAVEGLLTNFHQPDSTLILLIAAFVGENWRKIYNYALKNNFRFLSYGDASLLLP